jgi:hypothetical protein
LKRFLYATRAGIRSTSRFAKCASSPSKTW